MKYVIQDDIGNNVKMFKIEDHIHILTIKVKNVITRIQ